MELKEYLKILRQNLKIIVFATVLITLSAYVFGLMQPITYEANANLTIIPKTSVELHNVYEYGGYYDLQAAFLFGNTIATWLQSPDIVFNIIKNSGYQIEKTNSNSLSKMIKITVSPNSSAIKFQIKDKDKDKARKLANAAILEVKNKTAEFNQRAGTKVNFEIFSSDPVIIEVKPKIGFNTATGALAGLVLGIFLAFVFEYFRKS